MSRELSPDESRANEAPVITCLPSWLIPPRRSMDPEYRAEIKEYLKNSPEGGMFYFFRKNFPAPPYGRNIDTSGMHYKMPCVVIWGMQEPYF
ncbi:hypothetical protein J3F84DRAFT_380138 [Trichoderma pleuroticola]